MVWPPGSAGRDIRNDPLGETPKGFRGNFRSLRSACSNITFLLMFEMLLKLWDLNKCVETFELAPARVPARAVSRGPPRYCAVRGGRAREFPKGFRVRFRPSLEGTSSAAKINVMLEVILKFLDFRQCIDSFEITIVPMPSSNHEFGIPLVLCCRSGAGTWLCGPRRSGETLPVNSLKGSGEVSNPLEGTFSKTTIPFIPKTFEMESSGSQN